MSEIVIFGTGQIAEVVEYYIRTDSQYDIAAFTVDKEYISSNTFCGKSVVPFDMISKLYPPDRYQLLIPISYKKMNKIREMKYRCAKEMGYSFATYISSKAVICGNCIGENTLIFENNVIQPYARVGDNTIIWSGNHIGHHSVIENHCFIASHVVVSGGVVIMDNCFVGVNATIRDGITIAPQTLIGAGTTILHDTDEGSVYIHSETIKIKKHSWEVGL